MIKCIYCRCSCHWTLSTACLTFKVTSENTFCTLLKKLLQANPLTYLSIWQTIPCVRGAIVTKQSLSLLECKHGPVDRNGKKKLTFFYFSFWEKSIIGNTNIKYWSKTAKTNLKSAEIFLILFSFWYRFRNKY